MGDANKRGPYEKRKAEGIAKKAEEERQRALRAAEYEASLTPEQKRKRHELRLLLAMAEGIGGRYLRR